MVLDGGSAEEETATLEAEGGKDLRCRASDSFEDERRTGNQPFTCLVLLKIANGQFGSL